MSVAANQLKCTFAELKYEQLLADKYFVETCFSKKYESYDAKNKLTDMSFKISGLKTRDYPVCKETEICPEPYNND